MKYRKRILYLAVCAVFCAFMLSYTGQPEPKARYSAHPRMLTADTLQWVVENHDESLTIRCADYQFLQGTLEKLDPPAKTISVGTSLETVEIAPGKRVCETIPLALAPGRYEYTLRVAGDHGVNGTCRGKITID